MGSTTGGSASTEMSQVARAMSGRGLSSNAEDEVAPRGNVSTDLHGGGDGGDAGEWLLPMYYTPGTSETHYCALRWGLELRRFF